MTFCTACASSSYALRAARDDIALGRADVALVVGSESTVTPSTLAAFGAAGVLSRRNEDPAHANRPFDADRDGFVLGEGAGALVLESETRARARGARCRAVVAGIGVASDAFHPLACLPDGAGAARAIQSALDEAGLSPDDIGYINAHGTGTRLNDTAETAAIARVFGERAHQIPISSTKPIHGHLIGAAGVVEAVIAIQALEYGIVPPTANLDTADAACFLDYVPGTPRRFTAPAVLSNSLGFGGVNAAVLLTSARN